MTDSPSNQPQNSAASITLPEIPVSLRNYCIYTGRSWPDQDLSPEHPIPLALRGNEDDFVIRTHRHTNNTLGSKVDQPVIRDPIIMFGRRDANARGHHGHQHAPLPKFKNVRAYSPAAGHAAINDGPDGFKLEMTTPHPRVIHQPTKTVLPRGVFNQVGFVTEFHRNDVALCRFAAKTLLAFGWRMFLQDFERAVDATALRNAMNPDLDLTQPAPGDIRFLWETSQNNQDMSDYLDLLKSAMIKKGKSTVMICEHNGWLEWSVACVGYFVAALQIPICHHLLIPDLSNGQKMLITLEPKGHAVELGPAHPVAA